MTSQALYLLPQALAPSTHKNYLRSCSKYAQFCSLLQISPSFPISVHYACLFLVHLFNKKLSTVSLTTIISGLSYYHKICMLSDPFKSFPVRQLLLAMKKISPTIPDSRLPITEHLLLQLVDKIQVLNLPVYETTLFSTMFLFAFYFGLRASEFTSSQHNLQYNEVQVSQNSVIITFHSHKHSYRQSLPHLINQTLLRHCPVRSANKYISLRPAIPGPFFIFRNKPISPRTFSAKLKQI